MQCQPLVLSSLRRGSPETTVVKSVTFHTELRGDERSPSCAFADRGRR